MTRRRPDPKADTLRQHGCLHPHPDKVTDELFASSEFFDARDLVQVKYEMLRRVRVDGHSVSQSAARFGLSRPSYYQAQKAFERITSLSTGRIGDGDIYAKSFYMLGKIHEQKDNKTKAIEHYEKFLELWKDADPGIDEVDDARKHLAALSK